MVVDHECHGNGACITCGDVASIWSDSWPPGGYVCGTCETPTESEPCADHQPYAYGRMS